MPSPESPQNRTTTLSFSSTRVLRDGTDSVLSMGLFLYFGATP
jgi:hypothetical protein